MTYKTYTQQIEEHIRFLQSEGLDIETLEIDTRFIRCKKLGYTSNQGSLAYKTASKILDNGLLGLATWCRGVNGEKSYQSYGFNRREGEVSPRIDKPEIQFTCKSGESHEVAARKALGFWEHSLVHGSSDYLAKKRVGCYGLRFRNSDVYGRVAVVPLLDIAGKLWNYQLLNPDGSKRFAKDARTEGLFQALAPLIDGKPIGIAESYATAATCYELTAIPVVCAFSCHNLPIVAKLLKSKYPSSSFIVFADNDRHLSSNQGVLKAQEACKAIGDGHALAIPDFCGCEPSKATTDWNDLVRIEGKDTAIKQLLHLNVIK